MAADSIHSYSLSAVEGQLIRLHIEQVPNGNMFFFRVLDSSGALVTDASAWCEYEPPCALPLVPREGHRLEVRSPSWPPEYYPKDASYRLRVELAPDTEAAALRAQVPALLD